MARLLAILFVVAFASVLLRPTHVEAAPLDVSKAYFDDHSGRLSLADVADRKWTPFSGSLGAGYGSSAYWVRLVLPKNIAPDLDRRHALVLRITPTFIDQITVYQTCDGKTGVHSIGDQFPIADQAYPALSLNLFLEACALSDPIWLRIQSTSSRSADIEIMPVDEAIRIDFRRFMLVLAGSGMILFLLLLIAVYERNVRDPVLVAFAAQQITIVIVILLNNGVVRIMTDGDPLLLDKISSFATVLIELALLAFNLTFLKSYRVPRLIEPVTMVLAALTCLNLALVFSVWRGPVMFVNAIVVSVSIVFFFLMTLTIRTKEPREDILSVRIVMLYYGLVMLSLILPIGAFFGLQTKHASDAPAIYGLFTSAVMSTLLIIRARRRSRLEALEQMQMAVGLQKLKQEQNFREQQEQLFTMLVHEVKTPIAALQIAMSNAPSLEIVREKARRHLDAVTTIINHCNQAYRLEDPAFRIAASPAIVSKLLERAIGDHDIDIDIGAGVPESIETDAQLFHAIVGNLVDNAARYKEQGSVPSLTLGIEERYQKRRLFIEVSNVPGISGVPDAGQMFRKYYRSNNAHHQSGSGLGLFLAKKSALRLGGDLAYHCDGQVRFRLWLPV